MNTKGGFHFKNILRIMLALVLAYNYAIAADNAIPSVQVKWTINSDLKYVDLSITNNSDSSIKVDPTLAPGILYDIPTLIPLPPLGGGEDYEHGLIIPSLVFILSSENHQQISTTGGVGPFPVEIAPKKTKIIKFVLNKELLLMAKNARAAVLSLSLNTKEISRVNISNVDDIWKQKD